MIERELLNLLDAGDFAGASKYIEKLDSHGIDTKAYKTKYAESKESFIQNSLQQASDAAGELPNSRWEVNPYQNAVNKIDAALTKFPDEKRLIDAKNKYQALSPENVAASIYDVVGGVKTGASGTDASGFEHGPDQFNQAIYAKPDSTFKFDSADYSKVRILLTAQSKDTGVYSDYFLTISINGKSVFNQKILGESTESLLLEYDVEPGTEIEVSIAQSGFASFFERVAGINGVYFEIFRY